MGITNIGLQGTALVFGGSASIPTHTAIGTGTTAFNITGTTLVAETDRNAYTNTTYTGSEVTFVSDFSATEISGTEFTEFGLFNSGTAGTMFFREVITGSIVFAGERELQIQTAITFE